MSDSSIHYFNISLHNVYNGSQLKDNGRCFQSVGWTSSNSEPYTENKIELHDQLIEFHHKCTYVDCKKQTFKKNKVSFQDNESTISLGKSVPFIILGLNDNNLNQ